MTTDRATSSVLIADDDELSRLFLVETVEQAGFRAVAVADGAAALAAAAAEEFSLALLDVDMPQLDGYAVCRAVRSDPELKYLPVVMITGHDDDRSIRRAYEAGATDFISKPVNWTLLPHRMRYILRNADADRRLRHLAYHDPLTGLPNTQALFGVVADAIARGAARGTDVDVALLQVGVEACARIRATFGPDEGDAALRAFARTLTACVTAADTTSGSTTVARVDGDQFVVCLRDHRARERAAELAARLTVALDKPVPCGDHQFFLPPTIGVAIAPEHGRDAKTLLTHAATAKHHARATDASVAIVYTDEIGARARERLALGTALRAAVRAEQLSLYFQPKFRIADGAFMGVEALLRWFDADWGEVSPARFIPLAEESGLIVEIGRWVIQAACRQLMNWRNEGLETAIAVNVSAKQFLHDDTAAVIQAAALSSAVDPRSIIVEITESALIGDLAGVHPGMLALKSLGCRIAIDDFGTGYSSLAYLKGLPVDELKVDRTFVRNVNTDSADAAIWVAVLSLARDLQLSVTAEGVETEAQHEWLRAHACDEAQGYLFARPMPGHEILSRYGNGARAVHAGVRVA
jgi:diguanylate cyclase